jgi:hypothetical protein
MLTSGHISPDDSADDGRGGSKKGKKDKKDKSFVIFALLALFAPPGFHHREIYISELSIHQERVRVMWEDLFDKHKVELQAPQGQPVSKPTDQDLDEAEKRLGVPLPASYRAFAMEIGPGILCDWFRIYAPCRDSETADLASYAEKTRQALPDENHPLAFPFPVKDLIPFADTMIGDCFGFYPKEKTKDDEYAIYVMLGEPPPRVVRVADSFSDFIDNVVFGKRLVELKLYNSASWPMMWEPFAKSRKKTPAKNRKK